MGIKSVAGLAWNQLLMRVGLVKFNLDYKGLQPGMAAQPIGDESWQ